MRMGRQTERPRLSQEVSRAGGAGITKLSLDFHIDFLWRCRGELLLEFFSNLLCNVKITMGKAIVDCPLSKC
jgi:hypothetical protein